MLEVKPACAGKRSSRAHVVHVRQRSRRPGCNLNTGARIVVTRLKTGLEYPTTTERDGFYLVVLHLHDENEGERLGLDANGVKGELRARFDTRDKKVERGTRVDIRADRLVENRLAFAETLRSYLSR